jgi:hypothetical protein
MVLLPAVLAGCAGNALPELHPFTGTIEQGGKPVTTGGLLFQPVSGAVGHTSNASVTADGRFAAQTEQITGTETKLLPGIPVGVYRVIYHPPGDTQRSDLAVTLPDTVTVAAGGTTVALTLPEKAPAAPATPPVTPPDGGETPPKGESKKG